jgi:hypothetical protein
MSRIFTVMLFAVACIGLRANGAAGQVTSLLIWVHDTAGHPIAKAQVDVLNMDQGQQAPTAVTDSLGQLVCSVWPGLYRVSARYKGYNPSIAPHVVPVAAADTLRFVLGVQTWPQEPGVRMSHPPAASPAQPDPNALRPVACDMKR